MRCPPRRRLSRGPSASPRPERRAISQPDRTLGERAEDGVPRDETPDAAHASRRRAPCDERTAERDKLARHLARRGIADERVLAAVREVPRHRFVYPGDEARAYDDRPLALEQGQTISQPYIVAVMTEALALSPGARVLEVGTGSGYQTAILAELAERVYTIEIVPALAAFARERLAELGYANVEFRVGDGAAGWPELAPFDAILVTAAPEELPEALLEQLASGARLCVPIGPRDGDQELQLVTRGLDGARDVRSFGSVRFVPLVAPHERA